MRNRTGQIEDFLIARSQVSMGRDAAWPHHSLEPEDASLFAHRNGVISELTRFRFPMTVDDEDVAKCFGLEIARLLLDASFRDFAKARYESEKQLIQQSRPPHLQK